MKTYKVTVSHNGTTRWFNDKDQLHREEGPAVKYANGDKVWYLNGTVHREDGPAVEGADGYKAWYLSGEELTEERFKAKTSSCAGEIVEIDGRKYKLKLV